MNQQVWVSVISCTLTLCLRMGLGQKDCTGVECPVVQNCIEEALEAGECCASCVQQGCTCEGYQYYDCISAGFQKGKVPEGESYLVDFGSTECTCPKGGGRIGCHFIPCPEIPPNCIDVSEPSEGCPHCLRVGCVHRTQKYEAGHSFRLDPCQVCHCPNNGGDLMCSVVPECNSMVTVRKHLASSHPEESRNQNELHQNGHGVPVNVPTRHQHHPHPHPHQFPSNSLPLYTENMPDFENGEDYDYPPESTATSSPEASMQPSTSAKSGSEVQLDLSGVNSDTRKELKENVSYVPVKETGTYEAESPREDVIPPSLAVPTATTHQSQMVTVRENLAPESPASQPEPARGAGTEHASAPKSTAEDEEVQNSFDHTVGKSQGTQRSGPGRSENHQDRQREHQPTRPELNTAPKMQLWPTTSPPPSKRGREHEHHTLTQGPVHKHEEREEVAHRDTESYKASSREELVRVCCEAGEKWGSEHGGCDGMLPTRTDSGSLCWAVQSQCCSSSVRDSRCQAGIAAATAGRGCGADDGGELCAAGSYKECCKCCALGLRLRGEGVRCEPPRTLGHRCSFTLLTCCEGQGSDRAKEGVIRERVPPRPTSPPRRVSERPDRQSFSLDQVGHSEGTEEGAGGVLEDVDECQVYEGQLCHQRCINTPGSYTCACFPGYTLQHDNTNCRPVADDDENSLKEDDAPTADPRLAQTAASPLPGAPDPCAGNGRCAQRCFPVAGRGVCSCVPGFSLMQDGRSCEDIDECSLSTHTCQPNERCINTLGHFTCKKQIICPAGYQVKNSLCEDINECTLGTHDCGQDFECINTAGSFSCQSRRRCPAGFAPDTHGQCVDVDECRTVVQPCSSGFNCINTVGSYSCQRSIVMCGRGYHSSPDGNRCTDVDECQTGVHQCGEGQQCQNLPGTYRCNCRAGYQYDSFRRMCVDVNECWRYPGRLCAQTCENTPGSYRCSCSSGFRLSSDGKNCEDVNECLNALCSQECANVYGSFQCYCRQGFYLREDRLTCEDLDECSQSASHLCAFKCVNVPGSYTCVCPEHGYTMSPNGRTCRDIDECGIGAHNCTADESCFNIQGGFRCLAFSCPPNYRRVSDTRCERVSCSRFLECQNTPVRITYYQLSFQTNILIPAQIFRIGPSPAYAGDSIIISIAGGNQEGIFSSRKLNAYTGAIYLHQQLQRPRDFLLDVEMKLWRQGTLTTFLAKIYVFITASVL